MGKTENRIFGLITAEKFSGIGFNSNEKISLKINCTGIDQAVSGSIETQQGWAGKEQSMIIRYGELFLNLLMCLLFRWCDFFHPRT